MTNPKFVEQGEHQRDMIMKFIRWWWKTERCAPTLRDIQDYLKIKSVSTVFYHVQLLRKEGLLDRTYRGVCPSDMHIWFGEPMDITKWYAGTITSPCGGPDDKV